LTTDVIVGFPGETDEHFAETCRTVREAGFAKLHVFRFSPRQGTPAADLPEQIPETVKQGRAAELGGLGNELRERFFEQLIGRSLQVLVETPIADQPGLFVGTSGRYAPVELAAGEDQVGRLVRATAESLSNGRVRAVVG
ncbi:MAG TPA: tRNA (N(6)-L-threonylcarbamoyladenosine(37)-C(2))-methylthiotransferase MtaB, partial [Thermoguttaceae bacterium]|nr:tRNA (N(6)-L-threonylcarbamoyladenosine(37)-C(2))-methylthiotransferase MtaB [Thermoguttaceae bacterium]